MMERAPAHAATSTHKHHHGDAITRRRAKCSAATLRQQQHVVPAHIKERFGRKSSSGPANHSGGDRGTATKASVDQESAQQRRPDRSAGQADNGHARDQSGNGHQGLL